MGGICSSSASVAVDPGPQGRQPGPLLMATSSWDLAEANGDVKLERDKCVRDWCRSLDVHEILAKALPLGGEGTWMEAVSVLTSEQVDAALEELRGQLKERLMQRAGELASKGGAREAEAVEHNAKFSMDVARFGGLDEWYAGLEGKIGLAAPRAWDAIRDEHTQHTDSHVTFTTSNYGGTQTSPATEYEYVFSPREGGRYPGPDRTHASLESLVESEEARRAGLTLEEVACLRLYTGPMYMLYGNVLRASPSELEGVNTYTTTIHCIVSGIVKLSQCMRVPEGRRVFRGLGKQLPRAFWEPDPSGCCGGVEPSFMSCSTRQEVATMYSKSKEGNFGIVLSVEIGLVNRGAGLGWVSQFRAEEEVVFPPLSHLEVIGTPTVLPVVHESESGTVLVLDCRIACNQKALTIEAQRSRRHQLHCAMLNTLLLETKRALASAHADTPGMRAEDLVGDFRNIVKEMHRSDPLALNDDAAYRDAIDHALDLKLGIETKWAFLHSESSNAELLERIAASPCISFADKGFIYQLRSGTDTVPWSALVSKEGLQMLSIQCIRDVRAARVLWECLRETPGCGRVHMLSADGTRSVDIDTEQALAASEFVSSQGNLDAAGVLFLAQGLALNSGSLTKLAIPGNLMGDEGCVALALGFATGKFSGLLSLDLGVNKLRLVGMRVLSDAVSKHVTNLTSLRLAYNDGRGMTDELTGLWATCSALTSIDLAHTMCGTEGVGAFGDHFKGTCLRELDLLGSRCSNEGARRLCSVLKAQGSLLLLDLSHGKFGAEGCAALAAALAHVTGLKKLSVQAVRGGAETFDHLAPLYRRNTAMLSLVLGDVDASDEFVESLQANTQIKAATIIGVNASPRGAKLLASLLCRQATLCLVILSISGDMLTHVCGAGLRLPVSVENFLVSSSTRISSETASGLVELLSECTALATLVLKGLLHDEDGIECVAPVFRSKPRLATVQVENGSLSVRGAATLLQGLEACKPSLTSLVLTKNNLSLVSFTAVARFSATSTCLSLLDLSDNEWTLLDLCAAPGGEHGLAFEEMLDNVAEACSNPVKGFELRFPTMLSRTFGNLVGMLHMEKGETAGVQRVEFGQGVGFRDASGFVWQFQSLRNNQVITK